MRLTLEVLASILGTTGIDDPLKKEVMLELHLNSLFSRKHTGGKTSTSSP